MASALQARKLAEAEEALKQADKCLAKRSLFRATPDYLSAGPYLEKAAEGFRAAGDLERAKKTFFQAAGVQQKNQSSFRAAQAYENVAKVALQQVKETRAVGADKAKLSQEAIKAFDAACSQYSDMGELGKAGDALVRGAVAVEEAQLPLEDARGLYNRACSLYEAQEKPHLAVDTFRKTLAFLVKNAMYSEASALLDRMIVLFESMEQPANVHKSYLSQAVLVLTLGDIPAADQLYSKHLQDDEFLKSDECAAEEDLVRAFKLGNDELLQATIRKPAVAYLDNQVTRLARKLTLYGASGGVESAAPAARAAPSAPAPSRNPFAPSSRTDSRSKNPFAPSERTGSRQGNPFAPANRATPPPAAAAAAAAPVHTPAPVPAPVPTPPPAPVAVAPPPVAAEYEDEYSTAPPASKAPEVDESEFGAVTEGMANTGIRATSTDFDFDALEFAMPDSDDLEFKMPDEPAAPAAPAQAPTQAPQKTSAAPPPAEDDMFDLT